MKNQSSLSQRALLVNLTISQWTGRRTDSQATETVIKAHNTNTSAGAYTKRLLPGAKELEAVATMSTQIRKFFYEQTLPWMTDGSRIISAKNHLKFANELRKRISEFNSLVDKFIDAYPQLQANAKVTLNGLYNASEYPAVGQIGGKFKCSVNYMPLPDVKDFRVEVSELEKRAFVEKLRETENAAMRSVWDRLHTVVKTATEKLSAPGAVFRDSLLDNVRELCTLLPELNISEDPQLDSARREVEQTISGLSAESLRTDSKVRSDTAKRLKETMETMGAFMGQPQ